MAPGFDSRKPINHAECKYLKVLDNERFFVEKCESLDACHGHRHHKKKQKYIEFIENKSNDLIIVTDVLDMIPVTPP